MQPSQSQSPIPFPSPLFPFAFLFRLSPVCWHRFESFSGAKRKVSANSNSTKIQFHAQINAVGFCQVADRTTIYSIWMDLRMWAVAIKRFAIAVVGGKCSHWYP